jgi:uncharacterized membrane protein YphA (DoxX/SURF4 family)
MVVILMAARVYLGIFMLFSALGKLFHASSFSAGVREYNILSEPAGRVVSVTLPWIELAIALALLLGVALPMAGSAAGLLLTGFTAAVVVNLRRGRIIPCSCYGIGSTLTISWGTVARNGALLALALGVVGISSGLGGLGHWSIPWWLDGAAFRPPTHGVPILLLTGCFGVLVALAEWSVDVTSRASNLNDLLRERSVRRRPSTSALGMVSPDGHPRA